MSIHEKYSFQIYRNTNNKNKEIQITELQKYNLQIYRNTNYSNTEIQIIKLKKYNLQKCRNTNDRITEIQVKNYTNKTKVISADLLDFYFDLEDIYIQI